MNKTQLTLSCAALAFLTGLAGQASAHDVVPAKATKAATKTVKNSASAKAASAAKITASTPTASKEVTAVAPVQQFVAVSSPTKSTNPYLVAQSANPYLTGQQKPNPYLAGRPANPWLAPLIASPVYAVQAAPQQVVSPAVANVVAQAAASQMSSNGLGRKHITLSPLPVDIYMNPGIRPAIAFTTPCTKIAKMTNNFPPIMAFENFMFDIIGRVNESEALPFSIEPVCT